MDSSCGSSSFSRSIDSPVIGCKAREKQLPKAQGKGDAMFDVPCLSESEMHRAGTFAAMAFQSLLTVQIENFCKTSVKLTSYTMHLQPRERIGDQSHKLWIVLNVGPGAELSNSWFLMVIACFYRGSLMSFNDFQRYLERRSPRLEPPGLQDQIPWLTDFASPPAMPGTLLNAADRHAVLMHAAR